MLLAMRGDAYQDASERLLLGMLLASFKGTVASGACSKRTQIIAAYSKQDDRKGSEIDLFRLSLDRPVAPNLALKKRITAWSLAGLLVPRSAPN